MSRLCRVAFAIAFASAFALTAERAAAQTPYIPYFGKNQIRYDKFTGADGVETKSTAARPSVTF